jgi:hypothetical protein
MISWWAYMLPNPGIPFLCLSVNRESVELTACVEHVLSFHALARRYERGGKRDDMNLSVTDVRIC